MSSMIEVQPLEITLSSIWMLQPEYSSLRRALESNGYSLEDLGRGPLIVLARKGTVEIFSNIERRVVGIRSETSSRDLLSAYEELEKIYKDLGIEETNFIIHEFIGNFAVVSSKSPLEMMKKLEIGREFLNRIGTIMEKEVAVAGISLTTKDGDPTSSEWLHIDISPLFVSANKKYTFRIVYRSKKEEVVALVKTIELKIKKIIEKME